jgi:hypothetical protein
MAMIEQDRGHLILRPARGLETGGGGAEYILWFADIEGHPKRFAITRPSRGALNDGMGFDGSSITALTRSKNPTWSPSPIRHLPVMPARWRGEVLA